MKKSNYFQERNIKTQEKIQNLLNELPEFCMEFLRGIEEQTTSLTRLGYAQDLKIFFNFLVNEIEEFFGRKIRSLTISDLEKITATHLEIYLNYLSGYYKDEKYFSNTSSTKYRKLSAVRSMLRYFYKKEEISQNVSNKINTPKLREKEIIRLEVDEVVKLLDNTENPKNFSKRQISYNRITRKRDVALLTLLLGTGIRVSECVGLNISDIDFATFGFRITRKGEKQTILYFSQEVCDALKDYLEERKLKPDYDENQPLFLSLQNKRMSVRAIEKLVKKYSESCVPLKHITPHKLRSTYGTNLYRETGDIYIVADVLGHTDVNITKKHYAAISDNSRRNVARIVKLRDKQEENHSSSSEENEGF